MNSSISVINSFFSSLVEISKKKSVISRNVCFEGISSFDVVIFVSIENPASRRFLINNLSG